MPQYHHTLLFPVAFGIAVSSTQFLLVVASTLAVGSIPINIPASGTIAAAGALQLAGIHGAGVAGYLLVSRVVFSTETTVLAVVVLGWRAVVRKPRTVKLSELLSLTTHPTATVKVPATDY